MDKNTKRMKAERAKQEEAALNRILAWLAGGAVLEFILLLVNRRYSYADTWALMRVVIKVMAVVGLVGCVAGILWYCSARKRGAGTVAPAVCALFSAGLSLGGFAPWFLGYTGLRLAYIAVPVVVVLVLVYYLYQREFFLQACAAVLGLLGAFLAGKGRGSSLAVVVWLYVAAAVALLALCAWVFRKAQGNAGKVEWKGKTFRLFTRETNFALLYAGAAVNAAVILAAVLGVPPIFLYGVAAAWLLVMAVYYTVKLM